MLKPNKHIQEKIKPTIKSATIKHIKIQHKSEIFPMFYIQGIDLPAEKPLGICREAAVYRR